MKYSVVKSDEYEGISWKGWWTVIDNETSRTVAFNPAERDARLLAEMLNRDEGNAHRRESLPRILRKTTDNVDHVKQEQPT